MASCRDPPPDPGVERSQRESRLNMDESPSSDFNPQNEVISENRPTNSKKIFLAKTLRPQRIKNHDRIREKFRFSHSATEITVKNDKTK
jgi:hypothetical protein